MEEELRECEEGELRKGEEGGREGGREKREREGGEKRESEGRRGEKGSKERVNWKGKEGEKTLEVPIHYTIVDCERTKRKHMYTCHTCPLGIETWPLSLYTVLP